MKVFVANHKKFEQSYKDGYYPLLVGAVNKQDEIEEGIFGDDTGENISELNDSYCEVSGLYWIWKNVDASIVGLVHYRRFFLTVRHAFQFHDDIYLLHPERVRDCHIMTGEEANAILEKYELIVKKSRRYHWSLREKMLYYVSRECMESLETVLQEQYPEEYRDYCRYVKHKSQLLFNMFIGKKVVIDRYCKWLFPILEAVDQYHVAKCGERYNRREIGYFAELLFSFWVETKEVRYYSAPTIMPRKSEIKTIDGIRFEDGTNVFPINCFLPKMIKWSIVKVNTMISQRLNIHVS